MSCFSYTELQIVRLIFFSLRMSILAASWMVSLHVAAEPTMTYRGITLGDRPERVLELARKEFDIVNVEDPESYSWLVVSAGDKEGTQKKGCNFGTPASRQKTCLSVRLIFTLRKEGELLHSIMVDQGFSPPVAIDTVLDAITKAYGKPRLNYQTDVEAMYQTPASKSLSLIWGGNKTPVGDFRPSAAAPYEDRQRIGGRYISLDIRHKDNLVNGYSLRLIDSAVVDRSNTEVMRELDRLKQERKKASEAGVKF